MKATVKQGMDVIPPNGAASSSDRMPSAGCALPATGVIRRHPDIKWLRRDRDIAELRAMAK